jgi:hypothetical protein
MTQMVLLVAHRAVLQPEQLAPLAAAALTKTCHPIMRFAI